MRFVLILLVVIVVLFLGSWVNHKVRLKQEDELFSAAAHLLQVNGHRLSLHVSGNSESLYTLVFMAGGGTSAPILDFKTLYTLFEPGYRVVVVEKSGYGFSDIGDTSRDIATILKESRQALQQAGVDLHDLVLVPHSLSSLEALYWANSYPDEIAAIIGLDPAIPDIYIKKELKYTSAYIFRFFSSSGLLRLIPPLVEQSAAIRYGALTKEEIDLYKVVFNRRTLTKPMLEEVRMITENARKVAEVDTAQIPLLFFISDGSGTGYGKEFWQQTLTGYVEQRGGEHVLLECSHYVHNIEYKRIHEKSVEFLEGLL